MAISPKQWDRAKELFGAALECSPSQRAAFLQRNANDEVVRDEVDRLLAEHDNLGTFLSTPAFIDPRLHLTDSPGRLELGEGLSERFHIVNFIAAGGMGEVWLAEQKIPVRRTVALKLIKAGMDTKAVVARFESERQALALMDHPNIARVFDAGSTAEGRPFFVMEYVSGLPLTQYCDKYGLALKERLELFVQVCDGVQHAHQKAIIHRDLKPSNVLVVEHGSKAVPKIIDFGLAKAMAQRLTDKTMFTELGAMMGTPEYMSPEQADQREQSIDTRTDVYSLGAILYQLLTGVPPFEVKFLQAAGLEELLRVIREQEPPKPSTRICSQGPDCAASAEKQKEHRSFARHLQGELDWITMKALEKDRTRRYGSPAELAEDIGHYLHNEPVLAHPPGAGYRTSKFVRRHRFGVAAAASAVVLLIAFAVAMGVQARRIGIERNRVNQQAEASQRVADFMTGMFKVSDPSEARANSITAREILDKASKEIDTGLDKDPETQAQLMDVMGNVYRNLGLYARAQQLLEHALATQRRVHGPKNPETLKAAEDLGWVLYGEGRYVESEKLERETMDICRQVLGPNDPETLTSMRHLALAIMDQNGRFAEAEKMDRELLDIDRRVLGPEHPSTLATANNLALTVVGQGRYAEGEKMERELIGVESRVLGPEHPNTLVTIGNLAEVLVDEGRYAEAETVERELIDIDRRVLGPEHPYTAEPVYALASIAARQGHKDEALSLLRQAVDHGLPPAVDLAIEWDSDLKSLHGDKRFAAILADAKKRAAGAQEPH